jgi:hypothetical protein
MFIFYDINTKSVVFPILFMRVLFSGIECLFRTFQTGQSRVHKWSVKLTSVKELGNWIYDPCVRSQEKINCI